MARPTNANKGKESLINIGIKVDLALKSAIEKEGKALGITMGTYARQLLITGWRSRHEAPIAKNPREQMLIDRFNELPISKQEDVLAMVEALHGKYIAQESSVIDTPLDELTSDISVPRRRSHAPRAPTQKGGKK